MAWPLVVQCYATPPVPTVTETHTHFASRAAAALDGMVTLRPAAAGDGSPLAFAAGEFRRRLSAESKPQKWPTEISHDLDAVHLGVSGVS